MNGNRSSYWRSLLVGGSLLILSWTRAPTPTRAFAPSLGGCQYAVSSRSSATWLHYQSSSSSGENTQGGSGGEQQPPRDKDNPPAVNYRDPNSIDYGAVSRVSQEVTTNSSDFLGGGYIASTIIAGNPEDSSASKSGEDIPPLNNVHKDRMPSQPSSSGTEEFRSIEEMFNEEARRLIQKLQSKMEHDDLGNIHGDLVSNDWKASSSNHQKVDDVNNAGDHITKRATEEAKCTSHDEPECKNIDHKSGQCAADKRSFDVRDAQQGGRNRNNNPTSQDVTTTIAFPKGPTDVVQTSGIELNGSAIDGIRNYNINNSHNNHSDNNGRDQREATKSYLPSENLVPKPLYTTYGRIPPPVPGPPEPQISKDTTIPRDDDNINNADTPRYGDVRNAYVPLRPNNSGVAHSGQKQFDNPKKPTRTAPNSNDHDRSPKEPPVSKESVSSPRNHVSEAYLPPKPPTIATSDNSREDKSILDSTRAFRTPIQSHNSASELYFPPKPPIISTTRSDNANYNRQDTSIRDGTRAFYEPSHGHQCDDSDANASQDSHEAESPLRDGDGQNAYIEPRQRVDGSKATTPIVEQMGSIDRVTADSKADQIVQDSTTIVPQRPNVGNDRVAAEHDQPPREPTSVSNSSIASSNNPSNSRFSYNNEVTSGGADPRPTHEMQPRSGGSNGGYESTSPTTLPTMPDQRDRVNEPPASRSTTTVTTTTTTTTTTYTSSSASALGDGGQYSFNNNYLQQLNAHNQQHQMSLQPAILTNSSDAPAWPVNPSKVSSSDAATNTLGSLPTGQDEQLQQQQQQLGPPMQQPPPISEHPASSTSADTNDDELRRPHPANQYTDLAAQAANPINSAPNAYKEQQGNSIPSSGAPLSPPHSSPVLREANTIRRVNLDDLNDVKRIREERNAAAAAAAAAATAATTPAPNTGKTPATTVGGFDNRKIPSTSIQPLSNSTASSYAAQRLQKDSTLEAIKREKLRLKTNYERLVSLADNHDVQWKHLEPQHPRYQETVLPAQFKKHSHHSTIYQQLKRSPPAPPSSHNHKADRHSWFRFSLLNFKKNGPISTPPSPTEHIHKSESSRSPTDTHANELHAYEEYQDFQHQQLLSSHRIREQQQLQAKEEARIEAERKAIIAEEHAAIAQEEAAEQTRRRNARLKALLKFMRKPTQSDYE